MRRESTREREREGEEGERFVSKGFEGLEKEGKIEGEGGRFDDGLATRQHGRRKNCTHGKGSIMTR